MNIRSRSRVSRIVTAALPVAALVIGCASAKGIGESVNQGDDDAVIKRVVETMFTWDPGKDTSPADAFNRARPLMSATLSAQQPDFGGPQAGSQWHQWAYDRATITAKADIVSDEHPPDTADKHFRVVAIKQTINTATVGPGDATGNEINATVWVTAVHTQDGWRVDSIQT
jgi:hypothetical protein